MTGEGIFPPGYRASGLLMHVTSLPSPWGIGDLGPGAAAWIDLLAESGQRWWQVLPLGPTGHGDSPYQPLSTFAGNTLLVSPDGLIEDELLRPDDCAGARFPASAVDYTAVGTFKGRLLAAAWERFERGGRPDLRADFERFRRDHAWWLEDYALFVSLKAEHGGAAWMEWPAPLARREPGALAGAQRRLSGSIERACFGQFLLFRQGERLRALARTRGIALIGDMPFFVAHDSSDAWANPDLFRLDGDLRPVSVAGVPPDAFSAEGQLWGNPVYDWEAHRRSGYAWWIERLRAILDHVDVVRLDHFRAFEAAWHVPAGAADAKEGEWVPGPGAALFDAVRAAVGALPFIAEDLGVITGEVRALRDGLGLPGTSVLQFAFDGDPANPYLPANTVHGTVVYTGTHDNDTTRGWYESLPAKERRAFWSCLRRSAGEPGEAAPALMRLAWSSEAALSMAPFQDVLNLGSSARMNRPGVPSGNWRWRAAPDMLGAAVFRRLRDLTESSGRDGAGAWEDRVRHGQESHRHAAPAGRRGVAGR
jgi:4-alpha-glucanotransferase